MQTNHQEARPPLLGPCDPENNYLPVFCHTSLRNQAQGPLRLAYSPLLASLPFCENHSSELCKTLHCGKGACLYSRIMDTSQ